MSSHPGDHQRPRSWRASPIHRLIGPSRTRRPLRVRSLCTVRPLTNPLSTTFPSGTRYLGVRTLARRVAKLSVFAAPDPDLKFAATIHSARNPAEADILTLRPSCRCRPTAATNYNLSRRTASPPLDGACGGRANAKRQLRIATHGRALPPRRVPEWNDSRRVPAQTVSGPPA